MRFFKVLALGTLVFAAMGWSSIAKADSVPGDPNVTIRKCVAGCDLGSFDGTNSDTNPIVVADGSGVSNFEFCPVATAPGCSSGLAEVFLEVVLGPGETAPQFESEFFNCVPGLAATCSTVFAVDSTQNTPAVEFAFFGPVVNGQVTPFLTPGEIIGVSVPEPNGMLLLFVGLVSLVGFGLKRKESNLA
jgi:hypothetical protein